MLHPDFESAYQNLYRKLLFLCFAIKFSQCGIQYYATDRKEMELVKKMCVNKNNKEKESNCTQWAT
jgi:hypothetical protein